MQQTMRTGLVLVAAACAAASLPLAAQSQTAAPASAPTPAPAAPQAYGAPISLAEAQAIIRAGIAHAETDGLQMSIAVVEPSGELVAFARMDGAIYGSVYAAPAKARTAARYRVATASREQQLMGGRLPILSNEEVMAIGGGVPIVREGKVVGAVGVSGGTADQDARVASAIAANP
jgi:glc operon protein GlcG